MKIQKINYITLLFLNLNKYNQFILNFIKIYYQIKLSKYLFIFIYKLINLFVNKFKIINI